MFTTDNKTIRFTPQTESEERFLTMIKRQNGMPKHRRFNDITIEGDSVHIHLLDGINTTISRESLSDVLNSGRVGFHMNRRNHEPYAQLNVNGKADSLHRFLMRHELAKYEGFTEKTGEALHVHHIDNDTMNNRLENLAVVTAKENGYHMLLNKKPKLIPRKGDSVGIRVFRNLYSFDDEAEALEFRQEMIRERIFKLEALRMKFLADNRGCSHC